ncbi:MAG: transposase [Candidatus Hodarchaeota archaeon]
MKRSSRSSPTDLRFAEVYGLGEHLAVDSTHIPVRKMDLDAQKGYDTRGWFYGYKLHLLASCEAKLPLRAVLTRGNRHDAKLLPRLLKTLVILREDTF